MPDKKFSEPGFDIVWRDGEREPSQKPNPDYPQGIDLDANKYSALPGRVPTCVVKLPYPAERIGVYVITCQRCGFSTGCTTAGRVDDPRSITIPCKTRRGQGTIQ